MGYNDRSAVLQCFQIILITMSMILSSWAFFTDMKWNKTIEVSWGHKACAIIAKHVGGPETYNTLVSFAKQDKYVHKSATNSIKIVSDMAEVEEENEREFLGNNILRNSPSEKTAIALYVIVDVILLIHLIVACNSSNYLYQTERCGAVQGTVLFLTAFASIFTIISTNDFDYRYYLLSNKYLECSFLYKCHKSFKDLHRKDSAGRNMFLRSRFPKSLFPVLDYEGIESRSDNFFEKYEVCQHYNLKMMAAISAAVAVVVSCLIIGNALNLTTLYDEEDVDEDEKYFRTLINKQGIKKSRLASGATEGSRMSMMSEVTSKQTILSMAPRPSFANLFSQKVSPKD